MNQHRVLNTVAFAAAMLAIFFTQAKGPIARVSNAFTAQAAQVLARVYPASVVPTVEQIDIARVQTRAVSQVQRSQAKLACAHQLLQAKMQELQKAQQARVAAHAWMVRVADSRVSESDDAKDWE